MIVRRSFREAEPASSASGAPGFTLIELLVAIAISTIDSHLAGHTYTRHGKGDTFAWGDGHLAFKPWAQASAGFGGERDWFWMVKK